MRKTAKFFAAILSFFLSVTLFAQNSANVTGTLLDGNSGEPVGFATVSLTPKGSTKVSKYVLSTSAGKVTIEGVRHGTYTLKAEMMGYKTYTQEITIRDRNLALGDLKMEVDQEVLDAASVSAMGNAVVVKKDTVEYNASSFATTDNDMLINLLKKLPGIEVGDDGTITSNGERVTKIYIDGKTFFMDDPQLASQNIPAKMIEKLKVIKKKSEQAEFSGVDDGQEETVIDLSVQQSMMNGMFANVMLGAGHDLKGEDASGDDVPDWMTEHNDAFRFQSNAFIGNFRKNSQISLILNANNANTRGFGDIAGGNMRAMMGGGGGGFGGGGGGGGITTSWMGGLNGSVDLFDNDMQLAGNYVYNGSNTYSGSLTSRTTHMLGSEDIVSDTESHGVSNSDGHRFGIRLEHKFSENSSILFEPQVNFGGGNFNNSSLFNTVSVSGVPSNDGWSSSNGLNNNWATSGRFLLRQRLGMPGRTLT
ncbi:MAG: carboxypeptidase regulatory-like domain-containing protein, partial [Bacteroidales bacterium]|nr:carboxypeptidase regulatory-like domain-containing protein [Bacteroidales bacterium]